MPPRRLFADAAHYGAILNYLDGVDRLRAAMLSEGAENQGWYATWAVRSFENAHANLAVSSAGRMRGKEIRPEFRPEVIAQNAESLRRQALALVTQESLMIQSRPLFSLVVA